ncbi:MAG: hypothetical protein WCA44_06270 [Acidobacteriaceae bacterium]
MLHRKTGTQKRSTAAKIERRKPQTRAGVRRCFAYRADPAAQQTGVAARKRSPYWQPADEEC